ncbi:Panacea domain-containing protein [Flavobacterium lindanitolerans]|uniref:Panacea domain-containing protein n=1 Tax=Flavobacterium lindanitolerans TaxID=428988 RepID=UPI002806F200|nr:type II toxin-antitoxin system antitoxin SocA domain-containing protein [Flavobacterium lindanitolerans]MDQ7960378.1 DUF4065 domain-containing protein [Flavobacterium lindanitolerans]
MAYISYGWYLSITGKSLVDEKPQAWDLGPVMPSLYRNLKMYGGSKVDHPIPMLSGSENEVISDEDANFLDFIWRKYGNYTGVYLSAMTHTKGTPWSEIYPKGSNLEIPDYLIKEHYDAIKKNVLSNISSDKVE